MPLKSEAVKTVADAKAIVLERGLTHIKVGAFDIDGILRGKYLSREKFFASLDKGFGFCNVVLGWDSNDQLYDNTEFTGWHTGYPDAHFKLIAVPEHLVRVKPRRESQQECEQTEEVSHGV